MGDLANMTDCDGRVNGPRLLRWLRSRAEMERGREDDCKDPFWVSLRHWHEGRADMLAEMADDLERELTPPDYPEDAGDAVNLDDPAFVGRPEQERVDPTF